MRTLVSVLASLLMAVAAAGLYAPAVQAQDGHDLSGRWEGTLDVQGTQLRLAFVVVESDDGYSATVISIDQGNAEIPVATTTVDGMDVTFDLPAIQGEYLGTVSEDGQSMDGMWTQAGNSFPLELTKAEG